MKYITAVGGEQIIVDDEDFEELSKLKWRVDYRERLGSVNRSPSTIRESAKNGRSLPRILTAATRGMFVDHISGVVLDNRRANLRVCSVAENNRNSRVQRNSTSGFKGVIPNTGGNRAGKAKPWLAQIRFEGKRYRLGCFATRESAHAAYLAAAHKMHGDFVA